MRWALALAAAFALAQPPGQVPLGSGLPPVQPIPPFGPTAARPDFAGRMRPGPGWGFFAAGWQAGYLYPPVAPTVVVVSTQAPPREAPPPAPAAVERPPVRPQVSVYEWPKEKEGITRQAFFIVALKDSRRLRASAVWVQNGRLHLRTPEGEARRAGLAEIDRELTLKLNREAGLRLQLPPAAEGVSERGEKP